MKIHNQVEFKHHMCPASPSLFLPDSPANTHNHAHSASTMRHYASLVVTLFSKSFLRPGCFLQTIPPPHPPLPFVLLAFFFPPPFPGSKSHKVNLAKSWGNCGTWVLNMESRSRSNGGSEAEEILLNKGERADAVHRWWHQIMTSSSHWLHFCQISSICDLLNTSPCPASLGFLKSVNIMVCWTLSLQMQGQNADCLPTLKLVRTITSWSLYKMTWSWLCTGSYYTPSTSHLLRPNPVTSEAEIEHRESVSI